MRTKSKKIISLLMLLAGTLLVGFSMGRWLAPLAAWVGPALIIRYARDHKVGGAGLIIIAACTLAFLIGFGPIWTYFGLPMIPILAVLYGILWSLPFLADRLVSVRLNGFSSTLVYPLAATTLEFINIRTNPIGAWGATGFTQYGELALMQLASVTGMIGITFLMGWFASAANWVWEKRSHGAYIRKGLSIFGAVMAAVFIFGFLRLDTASFSESIRVAGITANPLSNLYEFEQSLSAPDPVAMLKVLQSHLDTYFEATVREAEAGAKVIFWSEGAGVAIGSDGESTLTVRAQEVAQQNGIYLSLPLLTQYPDTGQRAENKLLLIDPTGAVVFEHIKYSTAMLEPNRLVGERKLQIAETPFGLLSGVVCWDMDYPTVIQQAGRNGIGLLLVPSRDWFEVDPIHTHMAVFRAIENGTSLIRQADAGLSIAVDPYGRVLAQADFFGTTDRTMVAQIPVKHVPTIYSLFGRYLEWLAPVGFLILTGVALFARHDRQ